MAAPRRRNLFRRRRRAEDEGEDDGSVATEQIDSQSEASIPSDIDESADADDSDLSETASAATGRTKSKSNGLRKVPSRQQEATTTEVPPRTPRTESEFTKMTDTEAMMNGLKISKENTQEEAVDFEDMGATPVQAVEPQAALAQTTGNRQETPAERRKREHDEYKKKRDSDPAFIPNRGAFFMHDHRSAAPGQNGFRPFGRGRGRGGPAVGGPFSPANTRVQASEATSAPWAHDLHETLNEVDKKPTPPKVEPAPATVPASEPQPPKVTAPAPRSAPAPAPNRSFSTSRHIGNIQIRVFLPGMKAPIMFSGVPVKQHTRLPNHRPPLRRDKPVRISLPEQPPRYIFPATERSFIFIPRALRPNQQGFGRGRLNPRLGSYGGFSSRRTSVYGGSIHSPSIAMSRRSSLAREITKDGMASPAGSVMSRPPGAPIDAGRPVVRMPPGSQQHTAAGTPIQITPGSGTPVGPQAYPSPKASKTVSVAGIESPASLTFHAPQQQEQQPFAQQLPAHMNGSALVADPAPTFYPHAQQLAYPAQPSGGTPLSNIPERAIHAPAFQPYGQQAFQPPQPYPQAAYFYPAPASTGNAFVPATMPPQMPAPQHAPAPQIPAQQPASQPQTGASTLVAHEQNGMVYYYDASQVSVPVPVQGMPMFAPGVEAMYTMPGMGGMMTPSPDAAYFVPQGAGGPSAGGQVFYPAR
ncbi:hypothetical protein H2199_005746 [Coniosporium tulheliwenetii]|uniref:Uncharacterized protein n=1 Tax=Coniosporium tulheliwenetii TaxID=3383036 RepID=A0ACC2Z1G4_9PEZI|nr:hypothetical protein H2199_005746 [Cladosporium sp. JES 115]